MKRYISEEVLTVVTVVHLGEIQLPAITVVAMKEAASGVHSLEELCGEADDLSACVRENTLSLSETVHAELGYSLRQPLMDPSLWTEDVIALIGPGLCHTYTLNYPHLRGNNWTYDDIFLNFNASNRLIRRIFIHDPDYFVFSFNSLALPNSQVTVTPALGNVYYSLAVRDHRQLNTQNDPCMEEPDYSFTTCVKESLSRNIGCRLPWDCLSDQERKECNTLGQYQDFMSEYEVMRLASMNGLLTQTNCHKPCRYREYVIVEGPIKSSLKYFSDFAVELWMSSTDITILTEILVYPWTSLLAEFGGTFSLFFGLSFMTLWDGMKQMANIIKH